MAKVFPPNPYTVKYQGRVFVGNGAAWLTHSASAVEFNAVAKALAVTLVGDETARVQPAPGAVEVRARYAVLIDGNLFEEGLMDAPEKTIILFNSPAVREAKVKIIKLSEARRSFVGVKSIITDGAAIVVPETQRDLKLEFVGDSITCGYGIECKSQDEEFSTKTENVLKTYAYLAAQELNADLSIAAYSSFGVLSASTDDGSLDEDWIMPKYYEDVAYCENSKITQNRIWNFQNFHPTVVVVNLGTNDSSYTQNYEDRKSEFSARYVDFIRMIRKNNANAHIICTIGMMEEGETLAEAVERAVTTYASQTKDHKVSYLHFDLPSEKEGFALRKHPSEKTNARCAQALAAYIKAVVLKIKA